MDGQLIVTQATLALEILHRCVSPVRDLRFADGGVTLRPAAVTNESDDTATLEGAWDLNTQTLNAELSSDGMAIASLSRQISLAGIPLLSQATAGVWTRASAVRERARGMDGAFHLQDTIVPFEAFAEPLHIVAADAAIGDDGCRSGA